MNQNLAVKTIKKYKLMIIGAILGRLPMLMEPWFQMDRDRLQINKMAGLFMALGSRAHFLTALSNVMMEVCTEDHY